MLMSNSAIPDNRCLTECDFIRKNQPSSGQVVDFEQLIRKNPPVYGQTQHFKSTILSISNKGIYDKTGQSSTKVL